MHGAEGALSSKLPAGEIENGQLHGKGKIQYANGEAYDVNPLDRLSPV